MNAQTAGAFEVYEASDRWEKHLWLVNRDGDGTAVDPLSNGSGRFERQIARGEQLTVAYWIENTWNEPIDVAVDFRLLRVNGTTNELGTDAFQARTLMWRDRALMRYWRDETTDDSELLGDPRVGDADSDGSIDRADVEALYGHVTNDPGTSATTAQERSFWLEEHRTDGTDDASVDIKLRRDAEPLPLYRHSGSWVDEDVHIPVGESRMVWIVVTAPDDLPTGTYEPIISDGFWPTVEFFATGSTMSELETVQFTLHVPCWDTLGGFVGDRAADMSLWDYSYVPGTRAVEVTGVVSTGPAAPLAERRAETRMFAGSNAAQIYLGVPSRDWANAPTIIDPAFRWIFSGLRSELYRFEPELDPVGDPGNGIAPDPLPPFDDRRIKTIVVAVTSYGALTQKSWGTNPDAPAQEWKDRYEQIWVDFETEFTAQGLSVDDYDIVIVPVDEPTNNAVYGLPNSCTAGQTPRTTCLNASPICSFPKTTVLEYEDADTDDDSDTTVVELPTLFRYAARAIRAGTANWSTPPRILVNHHSEDRESCDHLKEEFDFGWESDSDTGSEDLVDIWMQNEYVNASSGVAHPLARSLHAAPTTVGDDFWWYVFDTDDGSDLGAMRFLQSGLTMANDSYTGHGNWTFWAADPTINNIRNPATGEPFPFFDPSASHGPDTFFKSTPRAWNHDTSFYFSPHYAYDFDGDGGTGTDLEHDNSADYVVPDGEIMIPGRVLFARRQAMELDLLMRHVRKAPFHPTSTWPSLEGLTTDAEDLLNDLSGEARDICHDRGDCDAEFATPDDVREILHRWLTLAYENAPGCDAPGESEYPTDRSFVETALEIDPWTN